MIDIELNDKSFGVLLDLGVNGIDVGSVSELHSLAVTLEPTRCQRGYHLGLSTQRLDRFN